MPHRVRHDFRGIRCRFRFSMTPFSQSSSSMAPPLPVILGLDPGIHGFSCFSLWMTHRVRHDFRGECTPHLCIIRTPISQVGMTSRHHRLPITDYLLPICLFPFEVKRPCPKKMVDFYMLQYHQSPAPENHALLQKQQFAPNQPSYRPGW